MSLSCSVSARWSQCLWWALLFSTVGSCFRELSRCTAWRAAGVWWGLTLYKPHLLLVLKNLSKALARKKEWSRKALIWNKQTKEPCFEVFFWLDQLNQCGIFCIDSAMHCSKAWHTGFNQSHLWSNAKLIAFCRIVKTNSAVLKGSALSIFSHRLIKAHCTTSLKLTSKT